jgi:hypothetical protein
MGKTVNQKRFGTKFKFINNDFSYLDDDDFVDFKCVDSPFGDKSMPNGEYLIRGDKESHSKEYYHRNDKWYLVEDTVKDNGHYYVIAYVYKLLPALTEKEWGELNRHYKKLTPYWRRMLIARKYWLQSRESIKGLRLSLYSYHK